MNKLSIVIIAFISLLTVSCSDHDDPKLAPIDTTKVKITANVSETPTGQWMNVTEEMTIRVSNLEMSAPKGVVLRSVSLIASSGNVRYSIDDKPYSGEPLEFKIPLTNMRGRLNFTLKGNLIQKNSRDAEIIIADNYNRQNEKCNFEKRKVHFLVFSGHFGRVCLTAVQSSLKRCLIG